MPVGIRRRRPRRSSGGGLSSESIIDPWGWIVAGPVPGREETFTAWDEASRFALAVTESNIPIMVAMAESVSIEPTDAGCRVTYRQGLQPRRGSGWLLALVSRRAPRELRRALGELRRLAEAACGAADADLE